MKLRKVVLILFIICLCTGKSALFGLVSKVTHALARGGRKLAATPRKTVSEIRTKAETISERRTDDAYKL